LRRQTIKKAIAEEAEDSEEKERQGSLSALGLDLALFIP